MTILVTGAAGFIGFHVSNKLLEQGKEVIGIDNINQYYDPRLKEHRLKILEKHKGFTFHKLDIANQADIFSLLKKYSNITHIIHLAAQAGVRYSIDHPESYVQSNLVGHMNMLELARHISSLEQFIYASSSSVYSNIDGEPSSINDITKTPKSLYAATKQCNEVLTHSYSHLYHIKATGLRFFTVYGPWGRPDMAIYLYMDALYKNTPFTIYHQGEMYRDFTYIDDIVSGILNCITYHDFSNYPVPHRIYNLGNHQPILIKECFKMIEDITEKNATIKHEEMHPGDALRSCADIKKSQEEIHFYPKTSLQEGLNKFAHWYKDYHQC